LIFLSNIYVSEVETQILKFLISCCLPFLAIGIKFYPHDYYTTTYPHLSPSGVKLKYMKGEIRKGYLR
jgi:hypothetical protein